MSGCIAQTGFHWTDAKPKKGETTKGILELKGVEGSGAILRGVTPDQAYFYITLGGDGTGVTEKGFKFDTTEALGKAKKMVEDPSLASEADTCAPISAQVAYRTKKPVPYSPVDELIEATFKVAISEEGGGIGGYVASGQWVDDGDGIAEPSDSSDDRYECSGFTTTYMSSKGFGPTSEMRELGAR